MATSPTYVDPRTGEEKEYPNAENIRKALEAKEQKQAILSAQSERQRRINYRKYSTDSNHVVRSKGVRQVATQFLSLSKAEQDEVLQLVAELTQ